MEHKCNVLNSVLCNLKVVWKALLYPETVCTLVLFFMEDPMVCVEAETDFHYQTPSHFQRQGKDTMHV